MKKKSKVNVWILMMLCVVLLLIVNVVSSVVVAVGNEGREKTINKKEMQEFDDTTIKIGLLFSTTGSSAIVEKSMLNAARLAFDEINEKGGINGKKISYIVEDYASNPTLASQKIENLILNEHVAATIGCYSSASRQATLPVLEENNSLLIYPAYTEGMEEDENVIYTGAMPNQQISEFIPWLMKQCGNKVFFIGSDYVFPVTSNKLAKQLVEENGGEICGEIYAPIGTVDFADIIEQIKNENPDFIFCDLIGDSVISFYKQYAKTGLSMEECPIASITMDEMTLKEIEYEYSEGSYVSMNYFSTLNTERSNDFVEKYINYVTDGSTITCLAETTYDSCYLLAEAMKKVEDVYDTTNLIRAFSGLTIDAPQGEIVVDKENHCTWMYSRFARIEDGNYEIVYQSNELIKPDPWIGNTK